MTNVLFSFHLALEFPDMLDRFQSAHPGTTLTIADPPTATPADVAPDADVVVAPPLPVEELERFPNLALHVVPFTGVNRAPLEWYREHGVTLANSHGNAEAVAERAVALLLAAAGRVAEFDRDLRDGMWHRRDDHVRPFDYWRSLRGARVAIFGTGAIGVEVATLLRPLVGTLVGFNRSGARPDPFDAVTTDRRTAASGADAIVLALPLSAATERIIDEALLATCPGVIVVNVARAELIDEQLLFDALSDGRIGAAGIDVWYRYPRPAHGRGAPGNRPFESLSTLVMSPHAASHCEGGKRGQLADALRAVSAHLAGTPIATAIDLSRGY